MVHFNFVPVTDGYQINRPHLAYTILGGFTSIFMLCSLFIKEKLYIGEATVATICGIIFGPIGAGLFEPNTWGNVDQITLECARIVLVVQCFAVGVELPKKYMTRHWKSVVFLLVPVMTYGWIITSLFIWWMIPSLSWLESLTCAACVTATDPVLASSVVGKGKFAKRIPKHLRDLLSAESGCNDGMAFPFIYLSLYLIKYRPHASEVFQHWFCLTVLYECVFGAIYGVCVGYAGRHAIKFAERKNLIDRESFLVFYFVLALWCAGTGSMLGLDDLLVGFCAGVAFSNDGWFSQQTEESHVSNVIDLLLNLAFFVFFGSIIPWSSYNRPDWGITPWRLVVIAIMVILFRRIPIMVALKPVIPDIKTWREALFAGHFGPIGVGAVFVAILARAELETGETTPLAVLPEPGHSNYILIELIWPITTFLILTSIIVHGSSIAVFTLGKHINTMRITMSYTTANEEPNWLSRLPRLTPKTSMSIRKPDMDDSSDEKGVFSPGTLPPVGGIPGGFLSRQPTGDDETPLPSRPSSIRTRRRKNWEAGHGPGGPISDSAIAPRRSRSGLLDLEAGTQSTTPTPPSRVAQSPAKQGEERTEAYQEGSDIIVENEEGDVIRKMKAPDAHKDEHVGPFHMLHPHEHHGPTPPDVVDEQSAIDHARAEHSGKHSRRRPAWAYRFDDNIVVEDEDGEVIRRYKLPKEKKGAGPSSSTSPWVGGWNKLFRKQKEAPVEDDDNDDAKTVHSFRGSDRDHPHNFRMHDERGRRLSKQQFLQKLQQMDPHARAAIDSQSADVAPEDLAQRLRVQTGARDNTGLPERPPPPPPQQQQQSMQKITKTTSADEHEEETAAERRRREAALGMRGEESDSDEEEGGRGRLERGSGGGIQWGEDVKGKGRE
ncbi:Sodium/hydrogen exchanger family-domain-containing protein [Sphaerosporella brunnea]|uniref:Sodium/hydrogen exchanger family-domain-containing protein n=1 Tax=Sphaerosporella brunnea TaxID=1250544 RepID=A0A5J5FC14_9PEZI|nr:Sodium/hydrogen exchanger family-domain-containing protein [Sphaerosporella brunnea]